MRILSYWSLGHFSGKSPVSFRVFLVFNCGFVEEINTAEFGDLTVRLTELCVTRP